MTRQEGLIRKSPTANARAFFHIPTGRSFEVLDDPPVALFRSIIVLEVCHNVRMSNVRSSQSLDRPAFHDSPLSPVTRPVMACQR